jgi:hypothetical protein
MSSYSPPTLGLDAYCPPPASPHTVERPTGILGMAMTPAAIEARAAEARFEQQLIQRGGLKSLAVSDPERFNELFPNVTVIY